MPELSREQATLALGEDVVAACPEDRTCSLSIADGLTLVLRPGGSGFVAIDREALWIPAWRQKWLLGGDGVQATDSVPFSWREPAVRVAHWASVPRVGDGARLAVVIEEDATLGLPLDEATEGVRVRNTLDWSPAVTEGVRSGDSIVAVAGVPVDSIEHLSRVLTDAQGEVTLTVQRGEENLEIEVSPVRRTMRCYATWELDTDGVVAAPPVDGVELACPSGALGLVVGTPLGAE